MKPKKRQKLCYNCEGEVDLDVIVCPFCAADLREEKPELLRSSYSPSATSVKQLNTEHSLYPSSYPRSEAIERRVVSEEVPLEVPSGEEEPSKLQSFWNGAFSKSAFTALFLFTLGVQLFLLGILLVVFSDKGVMILKWDASLWFLYIFASIPLLLFGYRFLNKL